jgi:hypothetical protein
VAEKAPTVQELADLARAESDEALVARFGSLVLVGPDAPPSTDLPGFRYATESAKRVGAPHPMTALLESVVYGLVKRAGSPFPNILVVGRAPNSDVWIDDIQISKLHARVALDPSLGHLLSDAGSANGTFVDDHRLTEREDRALVEGTRIRFGDRPFIVHGVTTLCGTLRRFPTP